MEHLKTLMQEHSMSQADLARLLSRDKSAITLLMQGKRQLKAQEAVVIAEHLGVAVNAVLGVSTADYVEGLNEPIMIPFHAPPSAKVQQGSAALTHTDGQYFLEVARTYGPHSFALEVPDEAMTQMGMMPADIVVADPEVTPETGQPAIFQHYDAGAAQTIIRLHQPPYAVANAVNGDIFPDLSLESDDVRLVAAVVQVMRFY